MSDTEPDEIYAKVARLTRSWWRVRIRVADGGGFFEDTQLARYDVPFRRWADSKARRAVARFVRRRELRTRYKGDTYRIPGRPS